MSKATGVLTAELVEEIRHLVQSSTEMMARLGGQMVNNVLQVETLIFDTLATPITREFNVSAGSIWVNNTTTHTITVVAGGSAGSVPTSGVGTIEIPQGVARTVPMASRVVTFYGTASDKFGYAAFAAGTQPVTG